MPAYVSKGGLGIGVGGGGGGSAAFGGVAIFGAQAAKSSGLHVYLFGPIIETNELIDWELLGRVRNATGTAAILTSGAFDTSAVFGTFLGFTDNAPTIDNTQDESYWDRTQKLWFFHLSGSNSWTQFGDQVGNVVGNFWLTHANIRNHTYGMTGSGSIPFPADLDSETELVAFLETYGMPDNGFSVSYYDTASSTAVTVTAFTPETIAEPLVIDIDEANDTVTINYAVTDPLGDIATLIEDVEGLGYTYFGGADATTVAARPIPWDEPFDLITIIGDPVGVKAAEAAAEAAALRAETAETNAETAETNAETAETNAETAETNAQASQTNAESARIAAETAQSDAETARIASQTAQVSAETAETNAETAQSRAEAAQSGAETALQNSGTALSFNDLWNGDIDITTANQWKAIGNNPVPSNATWLLWNGGAATDGTNEGPSATFMWINAAQWRALLPDTVDTTPDDGTGIPIVEWFSLDIGDGTPDFARRDLVIGRTSLDIPLITSTNNTEDMYGAKLIYITQAVSSGGGRSPFRGNWSNTENYQIGDLVFENFRTFISLQIHSGQDPEATPLYWRELGDMDYRQLFSTSALTYYGVGNIGRDFSGNHYLCLVDGQYSRSQIETSSNWFKIGNRTGLVSQADAEAGTSADIKEWSAQRIEQAIAALAPGGQTTGLNQTQVDARVQAGLMAAVTGNTETGIDVTYNSDGTFDFVVGSTPTPQTELIYFGIMASTDTAVNVDVATLDSESAVVAGHNITLGPSTDGDYFIILTPAIHNILTLINTGLNVDVLSTYTDLLNVRQLGTPLENYHAYTLGPLNPGLTVNYRLTLQE